VATSSGIPCAGRGGRDTLDKKRIIELRGKAQHIKATVHVGREGVSDSVAGELKRQLDKSKLVKVKLLESAGDDKDLVGADLARKAGATLVEIRGRTVVLARD